MIMEFARQSRGMLKVYGVLSNFLGQVFLGFGLLWGILRSGPVLSRLGDWKAMNEQIDQMPQGITMFIFYGLIALGVSQFINYLIEPGYKPGRILRYGDKILLFYAVVVISETIWMFMFDTLQARPYAFFLEALFVVLFTIGKVLILVGLAQVLKRILPMIEEAKTLV